MNTFVPSGLHFKTPRQIARKIREIGFNCVRLNWSLELYFKNPVIHHDAIRALGLGRVTALEVYQHVIDGLSEEKVMIILDNHMLDAGWCCDPRDHNGLWFNDRWTAENFLEAWEGMVSRFRSPYVIAADLHNEVRPDIIIEKHWWMLYPKVSIRMPVWGKGEGILPLKDFDKSILEYTHPSLENIKHKAVLFLFRKVFENVNVEYYDWKDISTRVGNRILQKNKDLLIIVQGLFDNHSYDPTPVHLILNALKNEPELWKLIGRHLDIPEEVTLVSQVHNLTGIRDLPLKLDLPQRVVYSTHFYPFFYAMAGFSWNETEPSYVNFSQQTDSFWGHVFKEEIAPVWIGEFGNNNSERGLSKSWLDYVLRYMRENDLDLAYWPLSNSRPTIQNGRYNHGEDEYGLLDGKHEEIQYSPLYESFKDLLVPRYGPGVNNSQLLIE